MDEHKFFVYGNVAMSVMLAFDFAVKYTLKTKRL